MFVAKSAISSRPLQQSKRSAVIMSASEGKKRVIVTGAGGRTGQIVMKKLLDRSDEYEPIGVVRSETSASKLKEFGASSDQIVIGDLVGEGARETLETAMAGQSPKSLIICTSAVPEINKLSLIPVIFGKIFGRQVRPTFRFKAGQMPEQVDWEAQKLMIDVAKEKHVDKVIQLGSMGGTQEDNFLNSIGDGNILVWKRRSETYLINSGLNYTIIHPGGLLDKEGGQREILVNVDDEFIKKESSHRSIPRADVAEICVQALSLADFRAIDVVAKNPEDGTATTDFSQLFDSMKLNCSYDDMKNDPIVGGSFASKA